MRIAYNKGIKIYNKSPLLIQNIFSLFTKPIPRSLILGSGFTFFSRELNKTQWYHSDKLKRYQESRLRLLIRHAYNNVPYYHKLFIDNKIRPYDIKTIEDLKKIPILTKNIISEHFHELISLNYKKYKCGKSKTSGSTGKSLTFYLDQQNREIEYASKWRQLNWANIDVNSKVATFTAFRGNLNWINYKRSKPLWKFNALSKNLEFNIYGLNKKTLKIYIKQLKKFRPKLIEGYPSAIYPLGKCLLEYNIKDITPIAIQTSSETLSNLQRSFIEKAFNCKVYDWYSQSEYVVAAGECPEGNYHIMESGIMEFIKNGDQVSEGEIGEIIGTSLYNYSMPFIRYRTTDIGSFSKERCNCKRGLKILSSLEGRVSDSIITPNGNLIPGPSFEQYWRKRISLFTPNVEYVHIIQKTSNRLLIEIVKKQGYKQKETKTILKGLKSLLGPDIQVYFKYLDSIPIRRKWRFTESELEISLI